MASRAPVPVPVPPPRDRRPSRPRRPLPPGGAGDIYGGPMSPGGDGPNVPGSPVHMPVISERELLTLYGLESMDTDRWVDLEPTAPPTADTDPSGGEPQQQPSVPGSRAGSHSNLTSAAPGTAGQLYLDDSDPLRLKPSIFRSLPRSLPNVTRDHLCIAHKDFDPKKFLSNVHGSATFRDLDYGLSQLRDTNDEHLAGMRTLVRSHFDDFVVAKATVDDAFRGWTERELDPATHYGTDAFSDTLDIATSTVTQVFGPILDRRRQAERIKSTLAVLERFKFFFNLPAGLRAHVAAGRWMEAVRDYKKGKALMAGLYPDLVATDAGLRSAMPGATAAAATPGRVQQKMLFETIWIEVVRVMATLQERLMRQLTEQHASRSADEQEAAIALVLDIDPRADPVWAYLESRFKWILLQLKERVSMWYREMPLNTAKAERFSEAQFRRAVHLRNKKEYDVLFAKDPEVQAWSARTALISDLTQTLVHSLPDFWKLAKSYIEGKYAPKSGGASSNLLLSTPGPGRGRGGGAAGRGFAALDLVKVEQCHKMVKDMAGYFGMLIQHALTLAAAASGAPASPAVPMSPASPRPPISPLPPGLVLPGAASTTSLSSLPTLPPLTCVNSITLAVFAPRMAAHMHACAEAIRSVKVPPDTLTSVVVAMERAKAGVLDMLLGAWMTDVKMLPGLDDWRLEGAPGAGSVTPVVPLFASYQKGMVQAAFKVARPLTPPGTQADPGAVSVTGAKLASLIVPAFFESTVKFLDAMHALVATDPAGSKSNSKKLAFPPTLPATDHWTWLALHVTCNLDHLDHILLPSLVTLVEGLAGSKLPSERAHLTDVVARMDQALMHAVLRRISGTLDAHLAQGFVVPASAAPGAHTGADAGAAAIQIRPWVYQSLLHLVNVHALCTRVFPPLTPRVLSAAFTVLATGMLDRVRKLDAAATAHLLQVTVEVEFVHQTLVRYESPATKEALEAVYFTLGGMYRPEAGTAGKVNEADVVKRVLGEAIRGTAVMFACFGGVQAEVAAASVESARAKR